MEPKDDSIKLNNGLPDIRINAQTLSALIAASPLGIFAIDLDGTIRLWNKAAENVSGWREDEVVGSSLRVLSEQSWEEYEELRQRTLRMEVFNSLPLDATRKDGSSIRISFSTAPILDAENCVVGTMAVVFDITENTKLETALKDSLEKMSRVVDETVKSLAAAIENRDPYTSGHQQRVAKLAYAIGREMVGLDEDRLKGIGVAATLHDIGKLHIPAEILTKPGQLTNLEFELIKTHAQAGYEILQEIEFPWPVARTVQQHHERLDGTGYPSGLTGENILLEARILSVADVVEAMSSHRPYRPGKGIDAALEEITRARGTAYDLSVVDACHAVFRNGFDFS